MTGRYVLDCTDCPFRTEIVGSFSQLSDAIEGHRDEVDAGPTEHFVNVHRVNGDG